MIRTNLAEMAPPTARADLPLVDDALWSALKSLRRRGVRFRRCAGIGPYVVDFLCPEERLIVEIDGAPITSVHEQARARERAAALAEKGYRVLRFWEDHVAQHLPGVLRIIAAEVKAPGGRVVNVRRATRH